MRILVTGAYGQVGQALVAELQAGHTLLVPSRAALDIGASGTTERIVEMKPDLVVHSAAFTNVDACAREPDRALLINALGTKRVALACHLLDIPLVYISTNEVFDGEASTPYLEFDTPHPINPYAYSKWAGEQAVQQLVRQFYIVRVAWVFGGPRNFVRTMLRLGDERRELAVVDDEFGNPTFAPDIAVAVARLIETPAYGIYHFVNEGYCSRYDFAREILHRAGRAETAIKPIKLVDYQRDSRPPRFGVLRNFVGAAELGIRLRPWQEALQHFLDTLRDGQPA